MFFDHPHIVLLLTDFCVSSCLRRILYSLAHFSSSHISFFYLVPYMCVYAWYVWVVSFGFISLHLFACDLLRFLSQNISKRNAKGSIQGQNQIIAILFLTKCMTIILHPHSPSSLPEICLFAIHVWVKSCLLVSASRIFGWTEKSLLPSWSHSNKINITLS